MRCRKIPGKLAENLNNLNLNKKNKNAWIV